jgi:hypothetical protein
MRQPRIEIPDAEILRAGARDTIVALELNPKQQSGVWLIMMMDIEGARLEVEFPDGRRMTRRTRFPSTRNGK